MLGAAAVGRSGRGDAARVRASARQRARACDAEDLRALRAYPDGRGAQRIDEGPRRVSRRRSRGTGIAYAYAYADAYAYDHTATRERRRWRRRQWFDQRRRG